MQPNVASVESQEPAVDEQDEEAEQESERSVDLNQTVSSLLRLNLTAMLIISLFFKLTVLAVINGSLNWFLGAKILLHAMALFCFLRNHFLCLQLAFVLDLLLFVVFVLFEFVFLLCSFVLLILQQKRNKNLGLIGVWLLLLITAIDLAVFLMLAIVVQDSRQFQLQRQRQANRCRRDLSGQLRLASGQSVRYSKVVCKSGSYLLGFVCHNAASLAQLMQPNERQPAIFHQQAGEQSTLAVDQPDLEQFAMQQVHRESLDTQASHVSDSDRSPCSTSNSDLEALLGVDSQAQPNPYFEPTAIVTQKVVQT